MDLWISSLDFECAASPRFLSSLNGGGAEVGESVPSSRRSFRCWLVSQIGFRVSARSMSGKLPDSVASCVQIVGDDVGSVDFPRLMSIR